MNAEFSNNVHFETERFAVVPLDPAEVRELLEGLLQDEVLSARVPWMTDKSKDGACRAAQGMELETAFGKVQVWSIIARKPWTRIGAIIARVAPIGIDMDVLVASAYWNEGVAGEAGAPVKDWLEWNLQPLQCSSASLH